MRRRSATSPLLRECVTWRLRGCITTVSGSIAASCRISARGRVAGAPWGHWLSTNGTAIFGTTHVWSFDLRTRGEHRGEWNSYGPCTVKDNDLFVVLRNYPGKDCVLSGIEPQVLQAEILGHGPVSFEQRGGRVVLRLPERPPDPACPALRLGCSAVPSAYQRGGCRVPGVAHPHYDPCPSELTGNPGGQ